MNKDFRRFSPAAGAASIGLLVGATAASDPAADAHVVAALDTEYQLAVKRNDAAGMARILHDEFILVTGAGTSYNKRDLLKLAQDHALVYELQDEEPGTQTVRVYGDTAIVTAKLLIKATSGGARVEKKLWFSDTYVRTVLGWRYAFGQASLALPEET